MSKKRKVYSADFKSKLVLEGEMTLNEIASKYEILPVNLRNWKKYFVANMSLAFDKSAVVKEYKEEIEQLKVDSDALAKKVGTLTIEKEWLEGKLVSLDLSIKREMIDSQADNKVSLNRQLELLSVSKTAYYYEPVEVFGTEEDRVLLNRIDEIYTKFPIMGIEECINCYLKKGLLLVERWFKKQ